MATRSPVGVPRLTRRSRILLVLGTAVLLTLILGGRAIGTYVDWLWYGEVEARRVFTTRLLTQGGLFLVVGTLVGALVWLSLWVAYRSRPVFVPVTSEIDPLERYRLTVAARVRLFGIGIPAFIGLIAGMTAAGEWETVRLFFAGGDFGRTDPEFGIDVGFYVFQLPFYNWLLGWIFVTIVLSFIAAAVTHYLFGGIRLGGRGSQFTSAAKVQLAVAAGLFVLFKAVEYFLGRYNLLFSDRNAGVFYGATYTDLNALMPAKLILMSIAVLCAIAFFVGAVLRNLQIPGIALVLLLVAGILVGWIWPAVLEQFSVKPNAIAREALSIERNMEATRYAYGLTGDKVEYIDYEGAATVTAEEAADDDATMPNVRLLDPTVLPETFTQQQQRRNFYGFASPLDVDRYAIGGRTQDYVVALREINTDGLAEQQRNWINRHLVYTHGNGFVAAPANTVQAVEGESGQGGYPIYTVSDTTNDGQGKIPVEQPRIYFGELMTDYAIVGNPQTADYRGEYTSENENYRYTGVGGVPVNSFFHRLVFAAHEGNREILFSAAIGEGSKIIYNRDPRQRVEKKAPWLTVDGDAYPAVVDGRIKWIVDAYTTTDDFPYAERTQLGEAIQTTLRTGQTLPQESISYIRNSVKATVDAYDGTVTLYSMDDDEPLLKAWREIFPGIVEPESEISDELRAHFRYPRDMFNVQRQLLTRYHVEDPATFYTNDARWDVPADPTEERSDAKQPPYYIMAADPRDPDSAEPQFQLTSVLTPYRRQFMAAFVQASSEPETYGQITVRRLPGGTQTRGPQQVQNDFRSNAEVGREINILEQRSRVIFGNLLTLPVKDGLIYVEPVYIQRQGQESAFPQLNRVLVYHDGRVGYAPNLPLALEQVLGEGAGKAAEDQPPGGDSPEKPAEPPATGDRSEAAEAMQDAYAKFREARRQGDYQKEADALEELEEAWRKYNEAGG